MPDPAASAARRGVLKRPAARAAQVQLTETHEGTPLSRDQFKKRVRAWANATREVPTSINMRQNDWGRPGYHYRLSCRSCECSWSGRANYDRGSNKLTVTADVIAEHNGKDKKWGGQGLSQLQKDMIRDWMTANEEVRIQQVMQALHKQGQRPAEETVMCYVKNLRRRDADVSKSRTKNAGPWNKADFQLLARSMKSVQDKAQHDENGLLLVRAHLADEHLCVSFVNPVLMKSVWRRVSNRSCLKVGADGVYKLCNQEYTLICLGLLVKECGGWDFRGAR
ncbi:unnamed protein product [Effrenium voratum]|nr:unnamed protein product [Effrenium voratum]